LLALLETGLASVAARAAVPAGHLYVANIGGAYPNYIRRYRLVDGLPAKVPDLTYQDAYGPIAVDAQGQLYSLDASGFGGRQVVLVFPPGSMHHERSILLSRGVGSGYGSSQRFTSLTVDAAGFTYVGSQQQYWSTPIDFFCAWEVAVYTPGAKGFDQPACLPSSAAYSLAVDAEGSLYMTASAIASSAVYVIANAASHPTVARVMYGPSFRNPVSVALDGNDLYVLSPGSAGGSPENSSVSVYAKSGDGVVAPIRTLYPRVPASWAGGILVNGDYLYVATGNSVEVFDKHAQGRRDPVAELTIAQKNITYIALGP
jgi:hypothetical protein